MNKYIAIAIVSLGALGFSSCSKFLDVKPQGNYTEDNFFVTDDQAVNAISSCYYRLPQESLLGREMYWEQGCVNDFVWGRTRSCLRDVFRSVYQDGMNRCNWIVSSLLKKQENTELTAIESRVLGEAYFLRAYYHFLIAYRYGTKDLGVPFVAYETVEGGYNNEIPEQQEGLGGTGISRGSHVPGCGLCPGS